MHIEGVRGTNIISKKSCLQLVVDHDNVSDTFIADARLHEKSSLDLMF